MTEYTIMEMLKARSVKLTDSFLTPNFKDIFWNKVTKIIHPNHRKIT